MERDLNMKRGLMICSLFSLLAIAIIVSGCTGFGQPQAPAQTPTPVATLKPTPAQPTYEITGIVRDYMGLPVYNAKVTLWKGDQIVSLPNNPQYSSYGGDIPLGGYDFKHVPRGSYKITAEKGGQNGSIDYPANGLTDIFISDKPNATTPASTVTATPKPPQNVYNISFSIDRSPSRDIIITNLGGDNSHLQTVRLSFIDNVGNIKGPDTIPNLANSGVSGYLNNSVGSMCVIDGDRAATLTHVIVYGSFDDGTMQVLSTADV
ncbi:MAG: carboxypeptidase-like regulatory domain-containing protein [Candidatus Doudnabacteria bacterium]